MTLSCPHDPRARRVHRVAGTAVALLVLTLAISDPGRARSPLQVGTVVLTDDAALGSTIEAALHSALHGSTRQQQHDVRPRDAGEELAASFTLHQAVGLVRYARGDRGRKDVALCMTADPIVHRTGLVGRSNSLGRAVESCNNAAKPEGPRAVRRACDRR